MKGDTGRGNSASSGFTPDGIKLKGDKPWVSKQISPPPSQVFHLCVYTFTALEVFKIQSLEVKVLRWRSERIKGGKCQSGIINAMVEETGEFPMVFLAPVLASCLSSLPRLLTRISLGFFFLNTYLFNYTTA